MKCLYFKDLLRGLFLMEARYELQVFVTKYQKLPKPKEIAINTKPKMVFRINKEKGGG